MGLLTTNLTWISRSLVVRFHRLFRLPEDSLSTVADNRNSLLDRADRQTERTRIGGHLADRLAALMTLVGVTQFWLPGVFQSHDAIDQKQALLDIRRTFRPYCYK